MKCLFHLFIYLFLKKPTRGLAQVVEHFLSKQVQTPVLPKKNQPNKQKTPTKNRN
jgi:hypothetical protein